MTIRPSTPLCLACLFAALAFASCRKAPPPRASAPPGRIVPAEVSGFEKGVGGWRVADGATGERMPEVVKGGASNGDCWLDLGTVRLPEGETTFAAKAGVSPMNWSRFGDTIRADVRIRPAAPNGAVARLYAIRADGAELSGSDTAVGEAWTTMAWTPRIPLGSIRTLGVRFTVRGPWNGSAGLDNVRVGAAAGLSRAWSVVEGPFAGRSAATNRMDELGRRGIESFPALIRGKWYVNLGTFSSESGARSEAARLQSAGLEATVVRR